MLLPPFPHKTTPVALLATRRCARSGLTGLPSGLKGVPLARAYRVSCEHALNPEERHISSGGRAYDADRLDAVITALSAEIIAPRRRNRKKHKTWNPNALHLTMTISRNTTG